MIAIAEQVSELAVVGAPRDWEDQQWVEKAAATVGYDANVLPGIGVARTHLHAGLGAALIVPGQAPSGLFSRRAPKERDQALADYATKAEELGIPVGTLVVHRLSQSYNNRLLTVADGLVKESKHTIPLTEWLRDVGAEAQA
jgi:hypothetical protein